MQPPWPRIAGALLTRRVQRWSIRRTTFTSRPADVDEIAKEAAQRIPSAQLKSLLREDGLLDNDDVVIVAARSTYPEPSTGRSAVTPSSS